MEETEESIKITQIIRLVHWIQTNSLKFTSKFIFDSENDMLVVNIKDNSNEIIYKGKVEAMSKKSELIKAKELEKMANSLIEIKNEIEFKKSKTLLISI